MNSVHFFDTSFLQVFTFLFYLKFCCIFPESFLFMQIRLELLLPEIVSFLENEELLSYFRVLRKSAKIVQTHGKITSDGPFHTIFK